MTARLRRCQVFGPVPNVLDPDAPQPATMSEYRVKFEVFEGPLDLLLYLIRKEEVDIYEVNLTKIATEFIEYLNLMRELDLDVAGEFVVMAATLMLIKSRELLPRDQRPEPQPDDEQELEDPRWELIRQLVEYKKFKDAASRLQQLEHVAENTFPRVPGRVELPEESHPRRAEASIFDLLAAVNTVLKRFGDRAGSERDVFEDKWSVSEKIESLLGIVRARSDVRFSELFHLTTSRAEVVVTFLALLELIRLRMLVCTQLEQFADIDIGLAPPPSVPGQDTPLGGVESGSESEFGDPATAPVGARDSAPDVPPRTDPPGNRPVSPAATDSLEPNATPDPAQRPPAPSPEPPDDPDPSSPRWN